MPINTDNIHFLTWGAPFVVKMKGLLQALLIAFVATPPMKEDILKFLRRCEVPDKDIQLVGKALFNAERKLYGTPEERRLGSALIMIVLRVIYDVKGSLSKDFVKGVFSMQSVPYDPTYDLTTPIDIDVTKEDLGAPADAPECKKRSRDDDESDDTNDAKCAKTADAAAAAIPATFLICRAFRRDYEYPLGCRCCCAVVSYPTFYHSWERQQWWCRRFLRLL